MDHQQPSYCSACRYAVRFLFGHMCVCRHDVHVQTNRYTEEDYMQQ
uniref:Uncharacterized protein n=1 Tax=Romanomermis culicivorax TaxID=13658 RepID=A0A915K508_ROMCU